MLGGLKIQLNFPHYVKNVKILNLGAPVTDFFPSLSYIKSEIIPTVSTMVLFTICMNFIGLVDQILERLVD